MSKPAPETGPAEPFLPFSAPWISTEEKQEVLEVLESDWITTGPRTRAFEAAFREYVAGQETVAVNSCTAALHLALVGLGIGPGDAVLTTPLTFAATANVVVHCGAVPCFVDIDPRTYNLSPESLQAYLENDCCVDSGSGAVRVRKSGARLRAIIVVHYAGQPCDMEAINELAGRYGLFVIEDAAHALGATYRSSPVGTLGDAAAFSFYPTKNITTGEGGMFTCKDPALAQRVRVLSLHGISRDAWKRYGKEGSWQYDVEELGFKYNLTDLAAALGLHQLRRLPQFLERRRELAAQYDQALRGMPLGLPARVGDRESAWHLYPVQVLSEFVQRDQLIEELRRRNIGTSVHFIPLHRMSYYQRRFGYRQGDFPVAEAVYQRIVSLPFFPRMRDEDVQRVALCLGEIFRAAAGARVPLQGAALCRPDEAAQGEMLPTP